MVAAAALIAGVVHADGPTNDDDLRNLDHGLVNGGNPSLDCWNHHKNEGMADSHYIIPLFPKQIKRGEPTTINVQIENGWKYDLAEIQILLNFTGNDTIIVPLGGTSATSKDPETNHWTGILGKSGLPVAPPGSEPSSKRHNFTVGAKVVAIVAHGEVYYPQGTGVVTPNRAQFFYVPPGSTRTNKWPGGNTEENSTWSMTLPYVTDAGEIRPTEGVWGLGVQYMAGDATQVSYSINVTVVYESAGEHQTEVFNQPRNPSNPALKPASIVKPQGVTDVIPIQVMGVKDGTQTVEVKVTALLYYLHQARATPNEDRFVRYATRTITVGDSYIEGDVKASTGGTASVDLYMMSGEVTGFAAAFLLLPSLLLGGTYGRASRKFLNDVLGGAKRRVMFHNLVSLGLTLVALIHIVFFLLEIRYTVMMGILWGGFSALSLLVLGLTGYYQVPLIQKYGYGWWRFVHLAFGLLVIVFVAWHTLQDGPDFFTIKQHMPQWLQDFNWAKPDQLK